MSHHSKALEKAKKHTHKKGSDGKCEVCNMVMTDFKDTKGETPRGEKGAKNNDSVED